MTNPSDHELNAVLARVLGLRWGYCPETNEHGYFDSNGNFKYPERTFDPLHDANQMEMVEAEVAKTHDIEYTKYRESAWWVCWVWRDAVEHCYHDLDKKRAFALAVRAMEQEKQKS